MLISIREDDPRPIYMQIVSDIKEQIRRGLLSPGDELPSVRELSDTLGINLHTVHRAYQILRDQGVIYLRLGQRARIAPVRQAPARREQVDTAIVSRLRDLITEAYHLGLSKSDFRQIVDDLLVSEEE